MLEVVNLIGLLILMNSFLPVTSFYALNLNRMAYLTSLSCAKRLDELSRTEIQAVAKQNNIRANLKTSEILAELNKLGVKFPVPVSEATEKHIPVDTLTTTNSDDGDGIHDKAREILSSQGIDLSDLLKLQKKLIKSSSPKMGKDAVAARNRSSSKPSNKDKEPSPPLPLPLQLQQPITKTSLPLTSPSSSSSSSSSVVEDKEDVLVLLEGDLINGGRKKRKTSSLKEIPYPTMDSSIQVPSQPDRAKPRKVASKDTATVTARAESPKSKKSKEIADVNLTGVTLSNMMTELVSSVGYDALYEETNLRCFKVKPTLRSSLKILRQEDMVWARKKVEYLFIKSVKNGVISTPPSAGSKATKAKAEAKTETSS